MSSWKTSSFAATQRNIARKWDWFQSCECQIWKRSLSRVGRSESAFWNRKLRVPSREVGDTVYYVFFRSELKNELKKWACLAFENNLMWSGPTGPTTLRFKKYMVNPPES